MSMENWWENHSQSLWTNPPPDDVTPLLTLDYRSLSAQETRVLHLHVWQGLTYAETAQTLGIHTSSAKVYYRRAVAKLKQAAQS